jgi:O-antigen/teichoic acid export membrane protein
MLIYQTLLYLPAQLLAPAIQLLAAVLWTHWLSPSEYGVLALIIAAQELISYVCLYWWSQYTIRYLASHVQGGSISRYQPTENIVLLASAVLQVFAALIALALVDALHDAPLIAATIIFIVTRSITGHLAERARASGRIGAYTLAQTAGPVLGCLVGFGAVFLWRQNATSVLWGFAVAQTIALPILWRMLGLGTSIGLDRKIFSIAARYGAPLLGAAVFVWLSVNGLRVVVQEFDGAAAVGLVSVGWNLGQRATAAAAMLVTAAAYPLAVKRAITHSHEAALTQLAQSGALLIGVLAPVTAGLLMVNQKVVHLLIGADFQSLTLAVLPIAVLSGVVRVLRLQYADQAFLLAERTDVVFMVYGLEALLTLPLCVAGFFAGGLVGACAGCLLGHVLAAILTFVLALGRFAMPFAMGHFTRITVATALMIATLAIVPWPDTRFGLALETIAGGLTYLLAIGFFYRSDLRRMTGRRFALQPSKKERVSFKADSC